MDKRSFKLADARAIGSFGFPRHCACCDGNQGCVFPDGPPPSRGLPGQT